MDSEPRFIYVRKLPQDIFDKFHTARGVRRLTIEVYFTRLVLLHERVRDVLDDPSGHRHGLDDIRTIVDELGLGTKSR